MKYRIRRIYKAGKTKYSIEKSRLGILWKPANPCILGYQWLNSTLEYAIKDLRKITACGVVYYHNEVKE